MTVDKSKPCPVLNPVHVNINTLSAPIKQGPVKGLCKRISIFKYASTKQKTIQMSNIKHLKWYNQKKLMMAFASFYLLHGHLPFYLLIKHNRQDFKGKKKKHWQQDNILKAQNPFSKQKMKEYPFYMFSYLLWPHFPCSQEQLWKNYSGLGSHNKEIITKW